MNGFADLTIEVHALLSATGEALLYSPNGDRSRPAALELKQRLFAWHAPTFYGTELEIVTEGRVEAIVLPANQVIPFFAEWDTLAHVRWELGEDADALVRTAPVLHAQLASDAYVPSRSAALEGKLRWTWDRERLEPQDADALAACGPRQLAALEAAFSAAVSHARYGTEAEFADLRREFPRLFGDSRSAALFGTDREWLAAVGWIADQAPFRPALQLLEPLFGDDDPELEDPERQDAWANGDGWDANNGEADFAGIVYDGTADQEPAWRLRLVLQDKRDESAVVPVRLNGNGEASGFWPDAWTALVRERSAGWLGSLRQVLPDGLVGAGGDVFGQSLDDETAWRFLNEGSRKTIEAGWQVLLPAWWETASRRKPRLRARVSADAGGAQAGALFGLDALVDFDWRIAIGDTDLSEGEFAELVARKQRLVRFRGQWMLLDPALLAQIRQAMTGIDRETGMTFQDVLQLHLLGAGDGGDGAADAEGSGAAQTNPDEEGRKRLKLEVELNGHLTKLIGQLGRQTDWPDTPAPAGLRADLRAYQREGFAWLAYLRRFGLGACLADDMGLGKTVQFIAYLLHIREESEDDGAPALIVCPTSVLGNWEKELNRFGPSLTVRLHYGSRRLEGEAFAAEARAADVVLTSYTTAALDQETLQAIRWSAVCLDEAQNIKNAQTKQSAAVRSLKARHRIALTGTPIENRLAELWSIYDFINPGFLGTQRAFQNRFVAAIERDRDPRRTADLQRLVKPFMLRRKKKDPAIRLELPEKNEMKTYIHLTAEQGALYEQTVKALMERMKRLEGIERKGAILAALTRLKQLCDHPALVTKEPLPAEGDDERAAADIEALITRSSKLERLLAMVKELREEDESCLIFTQYVGMGTMLERVLRQELGEPVLYLNGGTPKETRDRMISRFQDTANPQRPAVFVLSLKAGGAGLNLTAANHVFHFDRWWNPAVENQATDRAYRMGQTRDVQVHKFIALGTLEERIDEMLTNKQQLSDDVISSTEGWITELSTDDLHDLFALRREWTV